MRRGERSPTGRTPALKLHEFARKQPISTHALICTIRIFQMREKLWNWEARCFMNYGQYWMLSPVSRRTCATRNMGAPERVLGEGLLWSIENQRGSVASRSVNKHRHAMTFKSTGDSQNEKLRKQYAHKLTLFLHFEI